jgi:nucleoside-diphosphate-sugar epimerase
MDPQETVLVTGGSGFIGGWCVATLLERGYTVRTTVRSPAKGEALRSRLQASGTPTEALTTHVADLGADEGWDAAAQDCAFLLHVASPLGLDNPKTADALITPARDGALRALRAAGRAGVRRAVLTSSVAAATPSSATTDAASDETVWTDPTESGVGAYAQSKTLAERAAWAVMETLPGMSLAVVNPAMVIGPVMSAEGLGSVQVVQRLLNGSMPGAPRLGFNIVDVRDVADLHIRAMLAPEAAGQRFIAAGEFMWMAEMAKVLRDGLGSRGLRTPTRPLPDMVVRLLALFDPTLRTVTPSLGRRKEFSSRKAQEQLGWSARPAAASILECAESLFAVGAL